jgi:D-beta-D-heptose 7-phosphate kinase/D-beta-D-heptose 1-phosphate adenosyltransferase
LNSDASVRRLKGGTRPINSQEDRKRVLLALRAVDAVYIFDEDTPHALIKRVRPDIITKGGDYREQEVVGHDLAKVVILPYVDGKSTTGVIDACSREGLGSRADLVGRGRVLWEGLGL